jgi:hypothetical protein
MTARALATTALAAALSLPCRAFPADPAGPAAPVLERDALSLLAARCVKCHGGAKPKAKLDLRTPARILQGGESGPAVVPGAADKSLLFELVKKGEMPPAKAGKLNTWEGALLKSWIEHGPAAAEARSPTSQVAGRRVSDRDRQFWSFRSPVRSETPRVQHADRVRTPVDAFILAKLEARGLTLSPDADRATLLRRASIDLLGLPPTPEELAAFLADRQPHAYERLIDRLLASPHYGERWGRHWLDAAGYADTIGGDNDPGQAFPRESMWRYRDYVVAALNADKPYDQFLREQLAGDEMDDWRSAAHLSPAMLEHLIATGFLRTSVDHTFEDELNRPFERYQVLHDTIENLTSNLLGLTVACARCHDHKFDPIPQVEYYSLLAILKPSVNPEAWIKPQNHHLPDVSAHDKERIDRRNAGIDQQVADVQRRLAAAHSAVHNRLFEAKLTAFPEALRGDVRTALTTPADKRSVVQKYLADKAGPILSVTDAEVDKALTAAERAPLDALHQQEAALNGKRQSYGKIQAMWEPSGAPPTRLFRRGNYLILGGEVAPAVLSVLTAAAADTMLPPPRPGAATTGWRTAWARWLTRPDHPLTARVMVNRVWQHHFGEGIVATPDNFGHLGSRPIHPELLDWLATEFVRGGWSLKALHRLLLTSSVYRQASTAANSAGAAVDPGNQLLWTMRLRRVESEVVRDAVLAVSGQLVRTLGGPPTPIEPRADGLVVVASQGLPSPTAAWRRSLYLTARRNYNLTLLSVFDQPVMATNCTRRIASAVPLQSLTLLNDAFMLEQADIFAQRIAALAGPVLRSQVETAFRLALGRLPTPQEFSASKVLIEKLAQRGVATQLAPAVAQRQALARLCHMLLCANEFLYVG